MTILLDSRLGFPAPASFGVGLVDAPAPAKPRRPTAADFAYWQAFTLGLEGEDPETPAGLTAAEREAWDRGYLDGRADAHIDRLVAEHERDRELAASSSPDVPAWALEGPYDLPRGFGGHPAEDPLS